MQGLISTTGVEKVPEILSKRKGIHSSKIGVVKFLIDNGANIRYKDKNQRDAFEYAKIYSEKFMDDTLYQYLKPYYETGKELGSTEAYYGI